MVGISPQGLPTWRSKAVQRKYFEVLFSFDNLLVAGGRVVVCTCLSALISRVSDSTVGPVSA